VKIAIGAALVIACIVPSSAMGAALTIGSELTRPATAGICTNCFGVYISATTLPHQTPVAGRITEWKVRSSDPGALYALRTVFPRRVDSYLALGTSVAPSPVPPGTTDNILTYPASLPIERNARIGLSVGGAHSGLPIHAGTVNDVLAYATPGPADGVQGDFELSQFNELLIQATIRYCIVPNLVNKGVKKAKRTLRRADCTPKVVRRRSSKRRGKVFDQKQKPGKTLDPEEPVKIFVSEGQ
jgi:hypothetical protein